MKFMMTVFDRNAFDEAVRDLKCLTPGTDGWLEIANEIADALHEVLDSWRPRDGVHRLRQVAIAANEFERMWDGFRYETSRFPVAKQYRKVVDGLIFNDHRVWTIDTDGMVLLDEGETIKPLSELTEPEKPDYETWIDGVDAFDYRVRRMHATARTRAGKRAGAKTKGKGNAIQSAARSMGALRWAKRWNEYNESLRQFADARMPNRREVENFFRDRYNDENEARRVARNIRRLLFSTINHSRDNARLERYGNVAIEFLNSMIGIFERK